MKGGAPKRERKFFLWEPLHQSCWGGSPRNCRLLAAFFPCHVQFLVIPGSYVFTGDWFKIEHMTPAIFLVFVLHLPTGLAPLYRTISLRSHFCVGAGCRGLTALYRLVLFQGVITAFGSPLQGINSTSYACRHYLPLWVARHRVGTLC